MLFITSVIINIRDFVDDRNYVNVCHVHSPPLPFGAPAQTRHMAQLSRHQQISK